MAAANLGTAWIQVKPSMDGVRGAILNGLKGSGASAGEQMGSELGKSNGLNVGMAAIWGAASAVAFKAIDAIGNKLRAAVDGAIRRVDTLNNSNRTFDNMGFAAADSAAAVDALEKSIRGLPTPLDSALRGMTALSATYSDVRLGQKVFTALNNAVLGFGGSAAMVDNAIMQLSQLPMDGPLDAQTWNSLRNSGITPVLVAMAKQSGVSVGKLKEEFGSGQRKVSDFIDELIRMDKEGGGGLKSLEQIAKDSTKGIDTAMANSTTAISRGIAAIINQVGSEGIAKAISASGATMEKALKFVADGVKLVQENSDLAAASIIGLSTAFLVSLIPSILKAIPPLQLWSTYIGLAGLKMAGFAKLAFVPILIGAIVGALSLFVMSSGGIDGAAAKVMTAFDNITSFIQGLVAQLPGVISAIVSFVTNQLPQIFTSIIGAIQTNAPMIWEGFKALVSGIINALYTQGPGLIGGFTTLLDNVIKLITDNIGKFAEMGSKFIVSILNGITAALPGIIEAGVTIIESVVNAIVAALPGIIDAGLKIIDFLITAITDNVPKILASAVLIVTALVSGLIAVLPSLIDAALQIILALSNALLDNLPMIITAAIDMVMALVTGLLNNLPTLIQAAVKLVVGLVNGLIGALPQLITAAVRLVSELAGGLIANLPLIVTAAITLIIALVGALIQAIPQLIGAAFQLVFALIGAIIGLIPQLIKAGFELIVALVGGLAGGIWEVIKGAGQIGAKILETLGKIDLGKIGGDLIRGLWEGISNMGKWIGDKIKGFGDGVVNGLKSFFGIKSPSRLMRDQIGKMLGAGIGVGITRSTKDAVNAAMNQSRAVMEAYEGMNGPTLGFTSNGAIGAGVASGAGLAPVFHITNPSPEQTAEIVALRLRNQGAY